MAALSECTSAIDGWLASTRQIASVCVCVCVPGNEQDRTDPLCLLSSDSSAGRWLLSLSLSRLIELSNQ